MLGELHGFVETARREWQAQLLHLHMAEQAEPVDSGKYTALVFFDRIGNPWSGVKGLEIARFPVREARYVRALVVHESREGRSRYCCASVSAVRGSSCNAASAERRATHSQRT